MQTILGSGGAIGTELAKVLPEYTDKVRLVSRNPRKVNENDELISADLLVSDEVDKAVKDSKVVYVTVGFPYSVKVWKKSWPVFIDNVIDACKKYACKLVFFDNIYMYDPNSLDGMTEEAPINPISKKGQIRRDIAARIMDEVEKGKLTALIARAADFYGPGIKNTSMLTETVFNNLVKGKKANWMGPLNFKHSFTYTPDAGKATAILGNTADAYNQVWHLPTAENPFTGKEWINEIAQGLGTKPGTQVATKGLVRILGIFMPIMRELLEMMYQYDRNYVFNSSKFEKKFKFTPTPYKQGIKEIIEADYK